MQAAGHMRVADEMRLRVDAALAADTGAARTKAGGVAKCMTGRIDLLQGSGSGAAWRAVCRHLPE